MAKRNQNSNLQVAAISASVALIIVLVFYGGAITGNSAHTATFTVTADVAQSLDCSLSDTTGTFADLDASAGMAAPVTTTLTNNGVGSVDVDITSDVSGNALLGTGTTVYLGITSNNGGSDVAAEEINSTSSAFATTNFVTSLPSTSGTDTVAFNVSVKPATDSNQLDANSMVITFTCTAVG